MAAGDTDEDKIVLADEQLALAEPSERLGDLAGLGTDRTLPDFGDVSRRLV